MKKRPLKDKKSLFEFGAWTDVYANYHILSYPYRREEIKRIVDMFRGTRIHYYWEVVDRYGNRHFGDRICFFYNRFYYLNGKIKMAEFDLDTKYFLVNESYSIDTYLALGIQTMLDNHVVPYSIGIKYDVSDRL